MPSLRHLSRRGPQRADAAPSAERGSSGRRAASNADAVARLKQRMGNRGSAFDGPASADGAERWIASSRARQQADARSAAQTLPGTADGAERWQRSVEDRREAREQDEGERDAILSLLTETPSSPGVFAGLVDRIASLPADLRRDVEPLFHEQRARSVEFRNQRDNELLASGACNVTSLAMTLEQQGITLPGLQDDQQPEDRLTELLEEELGLSLTQGHHPGHIYENRRQLAERLGARLTLEWVKGMGVEASRRFFVEQVLPMLQLGASASIGIEFENRRGERERRHIVRLQWVDDAGITVDDPMGAARFFGDGVIGWNGVDMNSELAEDVGTPEGQRGADNHWSYEDAAPILRYIQWTSVPGTTADAAILERV